MKKEYTIYLSGLDWSVGFRIDPSYGVETKGRCPDVGEFMLVARNTDLSVLVLLSLYAAAHGAWKREEL